MLDARDLPTTASSPKAVELYEQALRQMLRYSGEQLDVVELALAEDPGMVMARVLRAYCGTARADAEISEDLAVSLAAAKVAAGAASTDREKLHVAALESWLKGDFQSMSEDLDRILIRYPRDILALQAGHLCDFYLGDTARLRDRVAQVLPQYDADTPGYGNVLGMYAFGLEECGEYERAEDLGRQAVAINPADVWAIHAVAHVMEMQGRRRDGIDWYESCAPQWSSGNDFATHNWWHMALYRLSLQEFDEALRIYDDAIGDGTVALDHIDASSLLWRLHLMEHDVGERWQDLADKWESAGPRTGFYCFHDCHALISFIAAGRDAAVEQTLEALRSRRDSGTPSAQMAGLVGLPIALGLIAFAESDYDEAIAQFAKVRHTANRFGGSHAQRDLLAQTLIEAAIRAGRFDFARALLDERTTHRPNCVLTWDYSARVFDAIDDRGGAKAARESARRLLAT